MKKTLIIITSLILSFLLISCADDGNQFKIKYYIDNKLYDLKRVMANEITYEYDYPEIKYYKFLGWYDKETNELNLSEDITGEVEVLIKYDGYIARQEQQVDATEKLEKYKIPVDIDYSQIKHISTETKEKLEKIRPTNLAQASRIGGVKPADISVLMVLLKG